MRAVQRFADIDVAEPRDHALIEQRRLERRLLARRRRAASIAASNSLPSGSGPMRAQQRLLVELRARHDLHRAEPARIVEGDHRAVRHVKHDMVVRQKSLDARGDSSRVALSSLLAQHAERARHAEMHQQHVAGGQIGEQIFGAAAEPADGLALQALRRNPSAAASAGRRGAPRPLRSARPPSPAPARAATVSTSGSSGMINRPPDET